jgi:hypothetical protein
MKIKISAAVIVFALLIIGFLYFSKNERLKSEFSNSEPIDTSTSEPIDTSPVVETDEIEGFAADEVNNSEITYANIEIMDQEDKITEESSSSSDVISSDDIIKQLLVGALDSVRDYYLFKEEDTRRDVRNLVLANRELALPILHEISTNITEDYFMRRFAIEILGIVHSPTSLDPLLDILTNHPMEPEFRIGIRAMSALEKYKDQRVVEAICDIAETSDSEILVTNAISRLSSHPSEKVFETISNKFSSDSYMIKKAASRSLKTLLKNDPDKKFYEETGIIFMRDAEILIADFESSEASEKLSNFNPRRSPANFYGEWVLNTIDGLAFTKPVGSKELLEKINNSTSNNFIKRSAQSALRTFN